MKSTVNISVHRVPKKLRVFAIHTLVFAAADVSDISSLLGYVAHTV